VLAASYLSRGEVLHARQLYEAADPEFKAIGSGRLPDNPNSTWYTFGDILSRLGEHDIAIAAIRGAVDFTIQAGNTF
jgi:hypothetical protein